MGLRSNGYADREFDSTEIFDICSSYRSAKNKESQISILADLYVASEHSIKQVLIANGLIASESVSMKSSKAGKTSKSVNKSASKRVNRSWKPEELDDIFDRRAAGESVSDIANVYSTSYSNIYNILNRYAGSHKTVKSAPVSAVPTSTDPISDDRASADSTASLVCSTTTEAIPAVAALQSTDTVASCSCSASFIDNILSSISSAEKLLSDCEKIPYDSSLDNSYRRGVLIGAATQIISSVKKELVDHVNQFDRK